jgi:carboxymethylenebutenolidase
MSEFRKEELNQAVFDLYDDYAHNRIDRRQFIEKLSTYAVGGLTLTSLLSFISPNYQDNIQVKADNPRLTTKTIQYNSEKGGGLISAQFSKPIDTTEKLPGIIVVHENRGLNPHIADVGRRAALAGFVSVSPDALSPLGGYPGNDDDGRALQSKRDRNDMLEDFIAAFDYLKNHPECTGKIGVVGFCFGGWIANMMAVNIPELSAAVPFYGGQPTSEETTRIKAPLLLHYAALDTRVNEGWPAYEADLKANSKDYMAHIYPNVNHGFHNDTTSRYDKPAADLAWTRTIDFFKEKLS